MALTHINLIYLCIFCTFLRGTRSYWGKSQAELSVLLHQIGMPTIFFTLSVVDMYWPDLHAFIPRIEPSNPQEAQKWRRQNIIDYPHFVAYYMHLRYTMF